MSEIIRKMENAIAKELKNQRLSNIRKIWKVLIFLKCFEIKIQNFCDKICNFMKNV